MSVDNLNTHSLKGKKVVVAVACVLLTATAVYGAATWIEDMRTVPEPPPKLADSEYWKNKLEQEQAARRAAAELRRISTTGVFAETESEQ